MVSSNVNFKSQKFNEYLFAGSCKHDADRRYALGWGGKGDPSNDPDMVWEVHEFPGQNYIGIRSKKHQEWMYAGEPKLDNERKLVLLYGKKGDPTNDKDMQWKIEDFGDYQGIQSVKFGTWLYMGNPKLDDKRRHALLFHRGTPKDDPDMRFIVQGYKKGGDAKAAEAKAGYAGYGRAAEEVRDVRAEAWYTHFRHSVFTAVRNAANKEATRVTLVGIRSDADKASATCEEWPLLQQDLRDAYTTKREPFWANGGSESVLEWSCIIESRVPCDDLAETLENTTNKDDRRAIVVSCNQFEMPRAKEIVREHNKKKGFTEVDIAWATRDDVYKSCSNIDNGQAYRAPSIDNKARSSKAD